MAGADHEIGRVAARAVDISNDRIDGKNQRDRERVFAKLRLRKNPPLL